MAAPAEDAGTAELVWSLNNGVRVMLRATQATSGWETVATVLDTVKGVLMRIVNDPEDPKFRKLKVANKTVQSRILRYNGGEALLQEAGFHRGFSGKDEVLFFCPGVEKLGAEELEALGAVLNWIESPSTADAIQKPAECILQCRVASGGTVTGAFNEEDPLKSVTTFVAHCERITADEVKLCLYEGPGKFVTMEDTSKTLRKLGLCPRASLMMEKLPRPGAIGAFGETEKERTARLEAETKEKGEVMRTGEELMAIRADKYRALKSAKSRTLKQFKDDRMDFVYRVGDAVSAEVSSGEEPTAGSSSTAKSGSES